MVSKPRGEDDPQDGTEGDREAAPASPPRAGVLIRAENGDVVRFDETGLILRLSDTVVADLRSRLDLAQALSDTAESLGDIDAWDLRRSGAYHAFSALLEPEIGPRAYRRAVEGGAIFAAAPGPLLGLLAFGGARRAGFNEAPPRHPYNIFAPADHIGAVGLEGTQRATPAVGLHAVPHATRETLMADCLLARRREAGRAPALFFARAETDGAEDCATLHRSRGYRNFLAAVDSLVQTATAIGKRPEIMAIGLDFGHEDPNADAGTIEAAWRSLMARMETDLAARSLHRPRFLAIFDAGTPWRPDAPLSQAHWQLATVPGAHELIFSAPAYMFAHDRFARPTEAGRARMAAMDAHALEARLAGREWLCPLPVLAEAHGARIRVTLRTLGALTIDPADPFAAGPAAGFALEGTAEPTPIVAAGLAADDPCALILDCGRPIVAAAGAALRLHYARGPTFVDDPAGPRGAVRDDWAAPDGRGGTLHRWACPATLPVHFEPEAPSWS